MQKKIKILFLVFVFGLAGFTLFSPKGETQEKEQVKDKVIKVDDQNGHLEVSPKYAKIGALAPDFITEDVHGNKIRLSSFRNKKPVLLAFWATWCRYCTKELPSLKAFIKEHQDQIEVIAVDSGESRRTIMNYIQRENVDFLMLLDEDRKIWRQYLVRATPTHFLIDREGKIVTKRIGFASRRDLESMLKMIKKE